MCRVGARLKKAGEAVITTRLRVRGLKAQAVVTIVTRVVEARLSLPGKVRVCDPWEKICRDDSAVAVEVDDRKEGVVSRRKGFI